MKGLTVADLPNGMHISSKNASSNCVHKRGRRSNISSDPIGAVPYYVPKKFGGMQVGGLMCNVVEGRH